ncbi:MAG: hypothetical protein AB8B93_13490 [Pseudomonadales bacterium]
MHVLAAAIGWYGHARIDSQQRLLRGELLPLSTASQRVASSIARLTLLSDSIESQRSVASLDRLQERINGLFASVETDLQRQGDFAVQFETLQAQFEQLKLRVDSGLQGQRQVIEHALAYNAEQAKTLELTETMQLALEILDPDLLGPRLARVDVQEAQRAVAAWQIDVLSVPRLRDAAALESVRLNLTQSLRATVRVLSQGQTLLADSGLSAPLFDLLNTATRPDGLFSQRAELLAAENAVSEDVGRASALGVQVAALLDALVARRNEDASQAPLALHTVLQNSERALYAVSFLALLLSVLFM